jgi:DNA-directed RNA polymerase alpha subunit
MGSTIDLKQELDIAKKALIKTSYQVYSMYLQGMTINMIAKDLGIPYNTAVAMVHRAKLMIEKYKEKQATYELIQKESTQRLLNRNVSNIPNLNPRIIKACRRLGIITVRDLVQHTEKDFLYIDKFGEGSLKQLKATLNQWGLSLGMKV